MSRQKFLPNYHKLLCIGTTSSGKTTLVRENILRHVSRKLMLDSNYELGDQLGVRTAYHLCDWDFSTPCYVPQEYTTKHLDEIIRHVRKQQNLTFFIDDLDLYTGGQYYAGVELPKLYNNGRHQNIGMIVNNKTIVSIQKTFMSSSTHVAMFAQSSKNIDIIDEWNGSLNFPNETRGNMGGFRKLVMQPPYQYAWFEPYYPGIDAVDPKKFVGFFKTRSKKMT